MAIRSLDSAFSFSVAYSMALLARLALWFTTLSRPRAVTPVALLRMDSTCSSPVMLSKAGVCLATRAEIRSAVVTGVTLLAVCRFRAEMSLVLLSAR